VLDVYMGEGVKRDVQYGCNELDYVVDEAHVVLWFVRSFVGMGRVRAAAWHGGDSGILREAGGPKNVFLSLLLQPSISFFPWLVAREIARDVLPIGVDDATSQSKDAKRRGTGIFWIWAGAGWLSKACMH
jgi:hypothetical protein